VLVQLVAVQRLPATGARVECGPRLVQIHLLLKTSGGVPPIPDIGTCNVRHKSR
jgi:hypothetical protein